MLHMHLSFGYGLPQPLGILLQYNLIPEEVKNHRTLATACHSFEEYHIVIYFLWETLVFQVLVVKKLQACYVDWHKEIQYLLQMFLAENAGWREAFCVFHLGTDLVSHDCVFERTEKSIEGEGGSFRKVVLEEQIFWKFFLSNKLDQVKQLKA